MTSSRCSSSTCGDPFVAAGQPAEEMTRVAEAIERQRGVAARVVVASLDAAMQQRADDAAVAQAAEAARWGPTASEKRAG